MPTLGSLFTGIGGLDLGLERAGFPVRWQVERDEWCRRVLAKHWPDVPRCSDVRDVHDARRTRCPNCLDPVDLIAGGFPCQPFSVAGRRRGTDDERWLWPEFRRVVRLLRPRYVLVENVPGLLAARGGGGSGLGHVLGDLAALGFDAEWTCIPAAAVGAPHLRWRVFIVAYSDCRRCEGEWGSGVSDNGHTPLGDHSDGRCGAVPDPVGDQLWDEPGRLGSRRPERLESGREAAPFARAHGSPRALADADGGRQPFREGAPDEQAREPDARSSRAAVADADGSGRRASWRDGGVGAARRSERDPAPADAEGIAERAGLREGEQAGVGWGRPGDGGREERRVFRGWSSDARWEPEPDVGRVAHGVPSRVDRLRGLGNAVVPQVAEAVGLMIREHMAGVAS